MPTLNMSAFGAKADIPDRLADVRYWHIADVALTLTNVYFEGKNGHDAGVTRCLPMTLSGT